MKGSDNATWGFSAARWTPRDPTFNTSSAASAATTEEREIPDIGTINNSDEQATLVRAVAALSLTEPDTQQCRRVIVEDNTTRNYAVITLHERPPLAATSHPIPGKPSPRPRVRVNRSQQVSQRLSDMPRAV
uniref:Uncharacterized protein n=1 Tax=Glossina palpalis gambiensis TaxID=67801 RepID=A0A1B0AS32_9MUSC